jgi:uncharacterized protein (TIGR02246 family)
MQPLTASDRRAIGSIFEQMANAWNAGDAAGFSAHVATDAHLVNIFGTELVGVEQIEERHSRIFETIFKGSKNTLRLINASYVSDGVIVARVSSDLDVPGGPLQGRLQTLASVVLRKSAADWEVVLFHNTRVAQDAGAAPR